MAKLDLPTDIAGDTNRIADGFTKLAMAVIGDRVVRNGEQSVEAKRKFAIELKQDARLSFLKLRAPPSRLDVLVTTQEVREAGPQEVLAHFKLKISKEAMQWRLNR